MQTKHYRPKVKSPYQYVALCRLVPFLRKKIGKLAPIKVDCNTIRMNAKYCTSFHKQFLSNILRRTVYSNKDFKYIANLSATTKPKRLPIFYSGSSRQHDKAVFGSRQTSVSVIIVANCGFVTRTASFVFSLRLTLRHSLFHAHNCRPHTGWCVHCYSMSVLLNLWPFLLY